MVSVELSFGANVVGGSVVVDVVEVVLRLESSLDDLVVDLTAGLAVEEAGGLAEDAVEVTTFVVDVLLDLSTDA